MISRDRLETLFDGQDTIGAVEQLLAEAWAEGWDDACNEVPVFAACDPGPPTNERNPYCVEEVSE